jgi:hypothetical protein
MTRKQADSQRHREVTDLLPWYVAGTLSSVERETVAAHLAACPDCHAEVGMLRVLGATVRESNERLPLPSDAQLPGLLARLEKAEAAKPRRQLGALGARLKDWWGPLPAFAKWAMAAQAVAVIALACASAALLRRANLMEAAALQERQRAAVFQEQQRVEALQERQSVEALQEQQRDEALQERQRAEALQERLRAEVLQERQRVEVLRRAAVRESRTARGGRETTYQSLSGPRKEVAGQIVKITVVFHEDATAKDIRDLLKAVPAKIVSGPSSAGSYELAIAVPPGADAQKLADAARARLRGRTDVVRMAELVP